MREYTKDDYGWFCLDSINEISLYKKIKIAVLLENGSKLFEIEKYENELYTILEGSEIVILKTKISEKNIEKLLKPTFSRGVDFITLNSPEYPKELYDCPVPPFILYYKGDIGLLKTNAIAIVGSRIHTKYGEVVTENFAKELSQNGFTIVSGLAEGLDGIAQSACLKVGGKTIAVLCGGLDKIYPAINVGLADEILKNGGLLITEQQVGVSAQKYMFPIRNRLMAYFSKGVLLTEASEHSGTKHTINHALDANRSVYCIPGSILNSRGNYGNILIKTCQSLIVLSPKDIVEDLGFKFKDKQAINDIEIKSEIDDVGLIREILSEDEYVHFEKILEKSKMDIKKLNSLLTKLEISGIIKKMAGNFYMLCK